MVRQYYVLIIDINEELSKFLPNEIELVKISFDILFIEWSIE